MKVAELRKRRDDDKKNYTRVQEDSQSVAIKKGYWERNSKEK